MSSTVPGAPAERLIIKLASVLRFSQRAEALCLSGVRLLARCSALTAVGYLVTLCLFLLGLRCLGERWWLLWPFLYMPPQMALLPLVFFAPMSLLFCPRALLVHAGSVLLVLVVYMGFRWSLVPPQRGTRELCVLTCNMGQRNNVPLTPFIDERKPDIIVLQDAAYKGDRYARQYPDRHVLANGEFVIISRFPIVSVRPVENVRWQHHSVAARFELDWNGTKVAVYAVHMPSPRRELGRLRGFGLLKEWAKYQGWFGRIPEESIPCLLESRIGLARTFVRETATETLPVVVAGDLNLPDWGFNYRTFTAQLRDAFRESGRGFGFTFPGRTRNPLTLFGPWLRLDYILCTKEFTPRRVWVEPVRRAQHRAVAAELAFPVKPE